MIENLDKTVDYNTFIGKNKWDLLGKSVSLEKIREKEDEFQASKDILV